MTPSSEMAPAMGGRAGARGSSTSSGSVSSTPKIFSRAAMADWKVL